MREGSTVGVLRQIVIDFRHPAARARFWAAALEGFEVLPYEAEIARLADSGHPFWDD